jgi:hypothetical protein
MTLRYPEDFDGAVQREEKHAMVVFDFRGDWVGYFFPADPTAFLLRQVYQHKRSAVRAARKWVMP